MLALGIAIVAAFLVVLLLGCFRATGSSCISCGHEFTQRDEVHIAGLGKPYCRRCWAKLAAQNGSSK